MWNTFFKSPKGWLGIVGILLILAYAFGDSDTRRLASLLHQTLPPESVVSPSPTPVVTPPVVLGLQATNAAGVNWYRVTKVSDGDTFKIDMNGQTETVRLVGVNTPETVDPRRSVECFGKEASTKLKSLIEGNVVRLEVDATQSDRDRYHRLLRFAFLPDGTDIGLELLSEGYAHESLYSQKPHLYRDAYVVAQTQAQAAQLGLWNPQACAQ